MAACCLTFADDSLGVKAFYANGERPQVTVQLGAQFISSAQVGDFVESEAEILRQTRTMLFVRGLLRVGERTVLSADGVWKVLDPR